MKVDDETGATQFEDHDIRDSGGTLDDLNLWLRTFARTKEAALAHQHAKKFDRDMLELRRAFDNWYQELLRDQKDAYLFREVLKTCRQDLFAAWLKWSPVYTTTNI